MFLVKILKGFLEFMYLVFSLFLKIALNISNNYFIPSSVTYLRLDGSVEPEKRFEIVKAFNSDPTIDALLLTTHGTYYLFLLLKLKK